MAKNRVGLGIDVGGTLTKIVAVTAAGKRLCNFEVATQPGRGPQEFVDRVCALVKSESEKMPGIGGVGIGLAGDVDSERGMLRFSPNLRKFSYFPFKEAFRKRLRVPVAVDNDANMAGWGAFVIEMNRRAKNMVCITLGTGVGGGIVIGGKLYQGSTGSAAEVGHICVEPDGELCRCGMRGCVEAYAGAYGIARGARKMLESSAGRKSLIPKICPDLNLLEPIHIERAAREGDKVAKAVWGMTGYYLGLGISNLIYVLNPDAVVIAGGVSKAGGLILDPVLEVLGTRPFKTPFNFVDVRLARTQNLGGLGAALAGLEAQ